MAVLLLVVAAGVVVGQADARPAERARLAGTTILTGARAGAVKVHLAQKATIRNPIHDQGSLRIAGRGNLAGFALVAENVPDREGWVLVGGRLESAGQPVYFLDLGGDWIAPRGATKFTVKPGDYALYLLPDSEMTEVVLRFKGLDGVARLSPTQPTSYRHEALSSNSPVTAADQHFSGTAVGALGGRGLVFVATWFRTHFHAATSAKTCFWRNEPEEPHASLPNCGDFVALQPSNWWGSSHWVDDRSAVEPTTRFYSGSWHPFSSGFSKRGARYGVSVSVDTASLPDDDVNSLAFWLTYR
ncbi:MAG: hypothetical protein M3323_05695 [Actinomycetota bacterium]|nr:hypothetical protein [Actinomycetota bacterium]